MGMGDDEGFKLLRLEAQNLDVVHQLVEALSGPGVDKNQLTAIDKVDAAITGM